MTREAELLGVIQQMVQAMRRSDPDYTQAHGCEQCSDDEWDDAIQAGEDALEGAEFLPEFAQGRAA